MLKINCVICGEGSGTIKYPAECKQKNE